ncbi:glycosyltransferase [Paradesertivirga mongoliensis]|uniref:Glycosyltransferase n=1 Tax=Paradesertivirga mongoliensis TaxID=2100740 RepID=A0ABW4ZLH1_9SPHI|nr:glycosyltransferase [Pedobacter mongoliensis]
MYNFKDVTLLITHYNRSSSLERLLKKFDELDCHFGNIIVSDDSSQEEHLNALKRLQENYGCRLITTPVNKGLGNNINKGQDAVTSPYTLYVQEDFVPQQLFPEKLDKGLRFMNDRKTIDMVRFYAYFKYPFLKPVGDGFSEMIFSAWPWYFGYKKFYYYSDHPHLRRSTFFEKFGRYAENEKVERTEYKMMFSFLKKKGKALFYEDYQALFDQKNSSEEPSTVKRNFWRENNTFLISSIRHLYRYLRFNFDLHF